MTNPLAVLGELAQALKAEPWKGVALQQLHPSEYDQVIRFAETPFFQYVPFETEDNPCQVGVLKSPSKNKWILAGNRGGKSLTVAIEDVADCLNLDPLTKQSSKRFSEPVRMWVVCDSEESSIAIMETIIAEKCLGLDTTGFLWNFVKDECKYTRNGGFTNHILEWTNGSWIRFKYSTQKKANPNAFAGEYLHKIHHDEVQPQDVYSECRARLVDLDGYFVGTCTPIYDKTRGVPWIYQDLYLPRFDKKIEFHSWTLLDNPYLSKEAKQRLIEEWDEDEIDARVYGMFVPLGVKLAFPSKLQRQLKEQVRPPLAVGDLEEQADGGVGFVHNPQGPVRIWENPVLGEHYAGAGDPAEGLQKGDDSCWGMFKLSTGEQVAEIQGKIDPQAFAEMGRLLGLYFGQTSPALLGIENTKDGGANRFLAELGYPYIYQEQADNKKAYLEPTARLGISMSGARRRTALIAQARKWCEDGSVVPRSQWLLAQMETFALHHGKFQGLPGSHDDLVMEFVMSVEMMRVALMINGDGKGSSPMVDGVPIDAEEPVRTAEEEKWDLLDRKVAEKIEGLSTVEYFEEDLV